MPNVTISIGSRPFQVACSDGEEEFLRMAANMLDREASAVVAHSAHVPESQMLLMSGLMLADRTASLEDQVKTLEAQLAEARAAAVPDGFAASLESLAIQAEGVAEALERATDRDDQDKDA